MYIYETRTESYKNVMKTKPILIPIVIIAICGLIVFSPGIVCIGLMRVCSFFDDHARIACGIADVAPIPMNAEILKSGGWSTGFSNQRCCVFKFDNNEQLEEWIKNSPSIRYQQPLLFTTSHPLIGFRSYDDRREWQRNHPDCTLYPPYISIEKLIVLDCG